MCVNASGLLYHSLNTICPCCGQPDQKWRDSMPYDRKCPSCGESQLVSAFNVKVECRRCDFKGWRDDFDDYTKQGSAKWE